MSYYSNTPTETKLFRSLRFNGKREDMPYKEISFPKIRKPKESSSNSSELDAKAEMDSMWMVGLLDASERKRAKKLAQEVRKLAQLPDSFPFTSRNDNLKQNERSFMKRRMKSIQTPSPCVDPKTSMTHRELIKLRELSDSLVDNKSKKGGPQVSPYSSVNRQINNYLRNSKNKISRGSKISSKIADRLFIINEAESNSATSVQRIWRMHLAKKRMKSYSILYKASRCIQSIYRGMSTRQWFMYWSELRIWLIVSCQALFRGYLDRKSWKRTYQKEYRACRLIQSIFRRFISQRGVKLKRMVNAAINIQCVWRCKCARYYVQKLILNLHATVIQKNVRRCIANKVYRRIYASKVEAICLLQRCWRGFLSRRRRNVLLYERMIESRILQVRILAMEEKFWCEKVDELESRSRLNDIENKITRAKRNLEKIYKNIEESERSFILIRNERECLSPRSIKEGWDIELDKKLKDLRNIITEGKNDALFKTGFRVRKLEEELQKEKYQLQNAREKKICFSKWRERELHQLKQRKEQHKNVINDRNRRLLIADERRKWGVTFTTPSGKPIKGHSTCSMSNVPQNVNSLVEFTDGQLNDLILKCNEQSQQNQLNLYRNLLIPLDELQSQMEKRILKPCKTSDSKACTRKEQYANNSQPQEKCTSTEIPRAVKKIIPIKHPWKLLHQVRAEMEEFLTGVQNDKFIR